MRILRIANIPNNRTGGMARAMYCTGDHLVAMGHQVDYVLGDTLSATMKRSGVWQRFAILWHIPALVRQLAKEGKTYDVVEIHEPLAAVYCWQRLTGAPLPPVVLFSHGLEKRHQLAELAYRTQKGLPISWPLKYLRITVQQSMYGLHHCDHVICLNAEDVDYLEQSGIRKHRISLCPNGVEQSFLQAGAEISGSATNRFNILFMGSWLLRKGTLDLRPVIQRVLEDSPQIMFTVAGCGGEVARILADFPRHLHPQIQVIPHLNSNDELIDVYRQHGILVLPSYFEGLPLVLLEAAALGLAVVATNICGMADFIDSQVNGVTVPVGDIAALQQALADLVNHPDRARSLGEAARKTVQSYTWENSARHIDAAYTLALQDANLR
jgi:glycosyltransferase involved in cell wall biosynthesis